ncbi:ATP-binding protein [Altererythrobacter sp. C41]|uniref:ATP-binding protein n=1 Tax=Altererythrobacter sp. C41 TaxID=2806021 RepID=UPI0019342ED6|nr:ATP-binding protein [Altererythrobacter sp. C41]MBM0168844.1 two-component sensor histidine kinase [Altererythrobacter sp. C41]
MEQDRTYPVAALVLAVITAVGMAIAGAPLWLALAVLLVWAGSLWLAVASPPPPIESATNGSFNRDDMGQFIEHAGTPLLVTENRRISIANRSARNLLGAHILGQDIRVAFRHPEAVALLERDASGQATVQGLVRRRDIWILNYQRLGEELGVIELLNQTAEADISRAHTDFVANASHELRTPLSSIIGYVETLREDAGKAPPETRAKFLDTVLGEARRLKNLVDDLMSLSRVEAEKHDLPQEHLPLRELVESAARDAAGAERQDRLDLDCEGEIEIRGDARQIEQLIRNLVDNALKYGAPEEKVSVTLHRLPEGDAELTVTDRGEGIAPEHLPHLTRRFYRTDPGRSRASGGTGLGLAIVKHIVERHRGRLDIASKLGQGTTITVRIPTVAQTAEEVS